MQWNRESSLNVALKLCNWSDEEKKKKLLLKESHRYSIHFLRRRKNICPLQYPLKPRLKQIFSCLSSLNKEQLARTKQAVFAASFLKRLRSHFQ